MRQQLLGGLHLGALLVVGLAVSVPDSSHSIDRRKAVTTGTHQKRADIADKAEDATLDGDWNGLIPLRIVNSCDATLWPAILSQRGDDIGTGGFELGAGDDRLVWVGPDWEGRIWGRTNCTTVVDGDGDSARCKTGDCGGRMNCVLSGTGPATLTEITLAGGIQADQSFYDISLVDGYNLPMAVNHIPPRNNSNNKFIPPNLTNLACIATAGWIWDPSPISTVHSDDEYPIPWETSTTNSAIRRWCPFDLLAFPPPKAAAFPYPDDNIPRPPFAPCLSMCAVTNSPEHCCTGPYHDPNRCRPSLYSRAAKAVCPDAYSYAYDDSLSTFTLPTGGGFEVVFCPAGRSTNILAALTPPLMELAATGKLGDESMAMLRNATYVALRAEEASGGAVLFGSLARPVLLVVVASLLHAM